MKLRPDQKIFKPPTHPADTLNRRTFRRFELKQREALICLRFFSTNLEIFGLAPNRAKNLVSRSETIFFTKKGGLKIRISAITQLHV